MTRIPIRPVAALLLLLMAAPALAQDGGIPDDESADERYRRIFGEEGAPDGEPTPEEEPAPAESPDTTLPAGGEPAERPMPSGEEPVPPPAAQEDELDGFGLPKTLAKLTVVGELYDELVAKKNELLPITFGGWHWFHLENGADNSGYGFSGLRGTYYYYILADEGFEVKHDYVREIGAHVDFRFRDDNDMFRPFYHSNYWLWEAYGYVKTPWGTLKGGKIWKRFGLDWDGSWWGNVPYFDGFKLDPDIGASFESSFELSDAVSVDTFVQYFYREDAVNGSIGGADPESIRRSDERDTGVVRIVPTIQLGDDSRIAIGFSGIAGRIENERASGGGAGAPSVEDELYGGVALDATYYLGPFDVFAEVLTTWGTLSPVRYLSGGASNRITNILVGSHLRAGPVTFRVSYSAGWDDNPSAWQSLFDPGIILHITKNIDLYVEYVLWEVYEAEGDDYQKFENGFQFILNWRF